MTNTVDLEKTAEFVRESIRVFDPDIDTTAGTPFEDIFIEHPKNTVLPQLLVKADNIEDNRSLLKTDQEEASYDELLANVISKRKEGTNTVITVNLTFSAPSIVSTKTGDTYTINDVIFHPSINRVFLETEFTQIDENEYSINVELTSEDIGQDTVVGVGSSVITPYTNTDGFIRSFVLALNFSGDDSETNEEAFERAQGEVSTRNNINDQSIAAFLSDNFPGIVADFYSAGMAEPEMVRDRFIAEIPQRVIRVYFSEKVNLTIPANTTINYNQDPGIVYAIKTETVIEADDPNWVQTLTGYFFELKVELQSPSNHLGFGEDFPFSSTFFESVVKFLGGHTRTSVHSQSAIKIGGRTDVYIRTPVSREKITISVPSNTASGIVNFPSEFQPIIKVHGVQRVNDDGITEDVEIFDTIVTDPEVRFSAVDNVQLFIDPALAGKDVTVDISHSPDIQAINNSINDQIKDIISEDILVKFPYPVFTGVFMSATGDSSFSDQVKTDVTEYVANIRLGSSLSTSKVIESAESSGGLNNIDPNAVKITVDHHLPDGTVVDLSGDAIITPATDSVLGVSPNNSAFLIEAVDVTFL